VRDVNFDALEAVVTMTAPDGHVATMTPPLRVYDKWQQQRNSEVAYESDLRQDVYMTLAGGTQTTTGLVATLEVKINPLVAWIWIGGLTLTVGGILCMLPRLLPQRQRAAARQAAENRLQTAS
jgi:cytochrome c-type biogenesis protein CcmF